MTSQRSFVVLATLAAGILLGGGPSEAQAQLGPDSGTPDFQETRYLGVGYAVNIPKVRTGASVFYHMPSLGVGLLATGRMSMDSPVGEHNFENWTVEDVENFDNANEQIPIQQRNVYQMVTAGVFRPIGPSVALYLAGGFTRKRTFIEFDDLSDQRGAFGYYWIENHDAEETGVNLSAGALVQAGRHFFFQGGIDSFPRGLSFAAYLGFPW